MSKDGICTIEGCNKKEFSGGLCSKHYGQIRNHGHIIETRYDKNEIVEHEDCYEIKTKNKNFEYVSSYFIDKDDYDLVKDYKWTTLSNGYAYNSKIKMLLHRFIMKVEEYDGLMVDHIDRDITNCRKSNLRIVTSSENSTNISKRDNTLSKYIGVSLTSESIIRDDKCCCVEGCNTPNIRVYNIDNKFYCGRHYKQIKRHGKITKIKADKIPEVKQKWRAYICKGGIYKTIGAFDTEEEALIARLKVELEEYGEEFAPQRHLFKIYNITQ